MHIVWHRLAFEKKRSQLTSTMFTRWRVMDFMNKVLARGTDIEILFLRSSINLPSMLREDFAVADLSDPCASIEWHANLAEPLEAIRNMCGLSAPGLASPSVVELASPAVVELASPAVVELASPAVVELASPRRNSHSMRPRVRSCGALAPQPSDEMMPLKVSTSLSGLVRTGSSSSSPTHGLRVRRGGREKAEDPASARADVGLAGGLAGSPLGDPQDPAEASEQVGGEGVGTEAGVPLEGRAVAPEPCAESGLAEGGRGGRSASPVSPEARGRSSLRIEKAGGPPFGEQARGLAGADGPHGATPLQPGLVVREPPSASPTPAGASEGACVRARAPPTAVAARGVPTYVASRRVSLHAAVGADGDLDKQAHAAGCGGEQPLAPVLQQGPPQAPPSPPPSARAREPMPGVHGRSDEEPGPLRPGAAACAPRQRGDRPGQLPVSLRHVFRLRAHLGQYTLNHRIQVFRRGTYELLGLVSLPHSRKIEVGTLQDPSGLCCTGDRKLTVVEYGLDRLSMTGLSVELSEDSLEVKKAYVLGDTQLYGPFGVGCTQGRIVVADSCNHRCLILASDGKILCEIGGRGAGPGQFEYPDCVATFSDGSIAISDKDNHRVQVFDQCNNFAHIIPTDWSPQSTRSKSAPPGHLRGPMGMCTDNLDRLYVCDCGSNRVQIFTREGKWLWSSDGPGALCYFRSPTAIQIDKCGAVYVASDHCVQIF
ncbi:unnamed protein product [Prorocentrum cordatum]|uniref:Uncharacterized protein n=1 Tax=Prorocentrum cordatum TaxID=2364126 RepID=A0ABN9PY45_9DINO|nr:unnamed protein product [Polarella glacialis]